MRKNEADMSKAATETETRRPVNEMTDRELLEEMAESQRKVADLVNGFFGDLKSGRINPMQMMMGAFKR